MILYSIFYFVSFRIFVLSYLGLLLYIVIFWLIFKLYDKKENLKSSNINFPFIF
jgi:hypothetical protein